MWTTLRDPRTAHAGTYHAGTVASLMRAVARRMPQVTDAMQRGSVSVRLTGAILDEDPMAPEVAWIGEDGKRATCGPDPKALLIAIRDAHGLGDASGRTLVIESWEAPEDGASRQASLQRDSAEACRDEAMLLAFEAEAAR